jgi:hypothetical protein
MDSVLTTQNLGNLRRILDEFGDISGLRCNYDKTCILKVGQEPDNDINTHGFTFTDTITLLGMEVKKDLSNQEPTKLLGMLFNSKFSTTVQHTKNCR